MCEDVNVYDGNLALFYLVECAYTYLCVGLKGTRRDFVVFWGAFVQYQTKMWFFCIIESYGVV